uniref:Uncharacterized protein n=1 Tax=viral metagenome TaxID=1070528 RepID=A0A6C0I1W0_9ZZZZ
MKYSITFYCYKLEKKTLSISISKKDDKYILTEVYSTESLDSPSKFTKEIPFIYCTSILHYLIGIFTKFYTDSISYIQQYPIDELPPTYEITNYGISINRYIMMTSHAKIKMESSIILYNKIIKDITLKLDKAAFTDLLKIIIKNRRLLPDRHSKALLIVADLISSFL